MVLSRFEGHIQIALNEQKSKWIVLGRIIGQFGIRGWVKVFSYTSPQTNILQYKSCFLNRAGEWEACKILEGRCHGKRIVARFEHFDDRDQASTLVGADIAIRRDQLPAPKAGTYFWADLENLWVQTLQGRKLGRVAHLFETGSNDVLVVAGERERLLPYIESVIKDIDLERGLIIVDWDPDF